MSMNLKQLFGSALLTVAVLGGAVTYLESTLNAPRAQVAYDTTSQSQVDRHGEGIVTEGPAS
ncbi:hypothetical protein FHS83_002356 [Rhizomicrobium palustre]|uniref:Uncharacterized protein n=1 Tax=Rhizomicrobium palustre TaxID=189966 RepID=A0A846MZJ0_9PROT|nr:hypothetical protein [Rhizomicrobium palustre]NIK89038.1 hypothetical protein [Rhizomicrobium palustre]